MSPSLLCSDAACAGQARAAQSQASPHPAPSHLFHSVWSCALGSENYDKSWSLLHCSAKFLHTKAFWVQGDMVMCLWITDVCSHNVTHMIVADHCARGSLNHRHLFVWAVYSTFLTMQTETNIKIVTLGKEATGKTALVERFLNDEYHGHTVHQATIAGSFGSKYFGLNSFAFGKQTFLCYRVERLTLMDVKWNWGSGIPQAAKDMIPLPECTTGNSEFLSYYAIVLSGSCNLVMLAQSIQFATIWTS